MKKLSLFARSFMPLPRVLYKDIFGLLLYLNGSIFMEIGDKVDRRIAYLRSVELLNAGGSLMIFPEGARNGMENLPVMALYQGDCQDVYGNKYKDHSHCNRTV